MLDVQRDCCSRFCATDARRNELGFGNVTVGSSGTNKLKVNEHGKRERAASRA